MSKEQNWKSYLALFSIYIIWGTTYLAIRVGVEDLPPVLFAGLRWIVAGPLFFVILILNKHKLPKKEDLIPLAIGGVLMLGIGNGLVVFAEQYVSSGLTALLITTVPFWFAGIDALMPDGKRINSKIIIGLTLGFAGVGLIFGGDLSKLFNSTYTAGVIGLMIAVFGWSLGTIYSKYKKVSVSPFMGAAIQMTIAGVLLTALGFIIGEGNSFVFTQESLYAYIYLVIVGSLLGYGSYAYAVAHLPISLVGTYAYVNPIIALFLGWLFLNEQLTIWILLASVVILVGVWFVKKGS